ncbi:beta-1,4-glucuronyltransferase 1-like [Sitophilus oryzae]|uniref:Beta-1,4-glucuronyltransferase 1-like n=1 Tax=Sitophilus oryzae TaxID=7048 RepID=A0A6J2YHT8_SITOR|nr:beta-1,4-glucuronyltransferase 1-like [Sitophilus oryzae]XP_030763589.1 beta-1,4-glucuronyltransferase 1-like [Sitophilus oryzae]
MVVTPFYFRQRRVQLLFTVLVILAFFLLLNSFQNLSFTRLSVKVPEEYNEKEPGSFVKYVYPFPSNDSYCRFNYALPKQFTFDKWDLTGTPEFDIDSSFVVLYNVIQSTFTDTQPFVTYATQLTRDFAVYVTEVVRYWEGPISIAAYIPDGNPQAILQQFLQFCYCIPEMSKVSLHLVFKKEIEDVINSFNFELYVPPANCDIQSFVKLVSGQTLSNNNSVKTKSSDNDSWYPINVGRNVARQAAFTDYVMVCDVELMPSHDLASRFMQMLDVEKCTSTECEKQVYVVPVFEVEASETVPRTKNQLISLLNQEKAVYFHRKICTHCQKFPGLERWMDSDSGDVIRPLLVTKREAPYHRWEPIYIGTKNEPLYHEKLSWEGFQDKMLQMLEMCLMNYKLVVLDGAFLVHWPGMKKVKVKHDSSRQRFKDMNQRQYNLLLKNMTARYPPNPQCRIK